MVARVRFREPAPHPVASREATPRRSVMPPSRTLYRGCDGPKEASAVADSAHKPNAVLGARSTLGTPQRAIDQLRRLLHAQSQQWALPPQPAPGALGAPAP